MHSGIPKSAIIKKAYEIAYAGFRVSGSLPSGNNPFGEYLERHSLHLLDSAILEDAIRLNQDVVSLVHLFRFGSDVGLVSPQNLEILIAELNNLKSTISSMNSAINLPDLDMGKFFTPMESGKEQYGKEQRRVKETKVTPKQDSSSFKEREKVIMEKIRQFGNLPDGKASCRLKDILDALPGISERTVRYDLQSLVESGVIERLGAGGPGTSYRLKSPVSAGSEGTASVTSLPAPA